MKKLKRISFVLVLLIGFQAALHFLLDVVLPDLASRWHAAIGGGLGALVVMWLVKVARRAWPETKEGWAE